MPIFQRQAAICQITGLPNIKMSVMCSILIKDLPNNLAIVFLQQDQEPYQKQMFNNLWRIIISWGDWSNMYINQIT
jgi:hypothetical protein